MKKQRGRSQAPPKPVNDPEDQAALDAAKQGVANVLKRLSFDRTLRSLEWKDLEAIATGAINGWVLKRCELSKTNAKIRTELLADAGNVIDRLGEMGG